MPGHDSDGRKRAAGTSRGGRGVPHRRPGDSAPGSVAGSVARSSRDSDATGAVSSVPAAVAVAADAPTDAAEPPAGTALHPASASVVDHRPKYAVGRILGSGGQGHVYRTEDRDLGRTVAMKVLRPELARDPGHVAQFQAEARRTGSLEHAGIPAVYELGSTTDGAPYFTMRLVQGRTLHEVLHLVRTGDPDAVRKWTLTKLVQVLERVAYTLEYAHSKGLVHRDLKPANIALADHDEVLVLDWGLSKRVAHAADQILNSLQLRKTVIGEVKGTPLYMAPEQAKGEVDRIERRTDVFALGALLYEILALVPPYEGTSVVDVVREARRGRIQPPSARAPEGRDVPAPLEETAMRALSPEPSRRQATAAAFAEELQHWIDGSRGRELRRKEADNLLREAINVSKKAAEYRSRAAVADGEATRLRQLVAPWAPPEEKAESWAFEDAAKRARGKAAQAEARAVEFAVQALAHVPDDPIGRELLARTYFGWYEEALERDDAAGAASMLKMARFYNDGWLDADLREEARLAVAAEADGAVVTLLRVEEQGRRLQVVGEIGTRPAPAIWDDLRPGRYLATVTARSGASARVPVLLRPTAHRTIVAPRVVFEPSPDGFLVVPEGAFVRGASAKPAETVIGTFWIAEVPVLLEEYAAWLDELHEDDPDAAQAHLPWAPTHGPLLVHAGGRYVPCKGSPMAEKPVELEPRLPVVGITRTSARLYAEWLGKKLGRRVSLPTEAQWEKAARGTDGRLFPWGDRFDPTFCNMSLSSPRGPRLRSVGAFPADVSPYGVRDLAGNVREWTDDDDDGDSRAAVARGGAWNHTADECRAVSRWVLDPATKSVSVGFRLVVTPGWTGERGGS